MNTRLIRLFLSFTPVWFALVACAPPGGVPSVVNRGTLVSSPGDQARGGQPTHQTGQVQPSEPGVPTVARPTQGTADPSGGGNGTQNRVLEQYARPLAHEPAWTQKIEPILDHLDRARRPGVFRSHAGLVIRQLHVVPLRQIANRMKWYFMPQSLALLSRETLGLPETLQLEQLAIQRGHEVWIDAKKYQSSSLDDQASLLLHEVVMFLYRTRELSDIELCQLLRTSPGRDCSLGLNGRLRGRDAEKSGRVQPDDGQFRSLPVAASQFRPLQPTDYLAIRTFTSWLLRLGTSAQAEDVAHQLKVNGFDPRLLKLYNSGGLSLRNRAFDDWGRRVVQNSTLFAHWGTRDGFGPRDCRTLGVQLEVPQQESSCGARFVRHGNRAAVDLRTATQERILLTHFAGDRPQLGLNGAVLRRVDGQAPMKASFVGFFREWPQGAGRERRWAVSLAGVNGTETGLTHLVMIPYRTSSQDAPRSPMVSGGTDERFSSQPVIQPKTLVRDATSPIYIIELTESAVRFSGLDSPEFFQVDQLEDHSRSPVNWRAGVPGLIPRAGEQRRIRAGAYTTDLSDPARIWPPSVEQGTPEADPADYLNRGEMSKARSDENHESARGTANPQ